ncbi:hypothetical protein DFH28DRAFT_887900 [Melampsora americana]|nr:hypothetical protein DFH28DRAFT_887900 [Melampsora americana]
MNFVQGTHPNPIQSSSSLQSPSPSPSQTNPSSIHHRSSKAKLHSKSIHSSIPSTSTTHSLHKRIKVGARASIACETCRRRKVRCSGQYPICTFCATRSLKCDYDGNIHIQNTQSSSDDHLNPSTSSSPHPFTPSTSPSITSTSSTINSSISNLHHLDLPDHQIQRLAFNAFFTHFSDESLFTFIHRPTLMRQLENQTIDHEILLCILTLAQRFCDPLKALHVDDLQPSSQSYSTQLLNLIRSNPDLISISRVQVHLMLGLHHCTQYQEHTGWMHIGIAIRMAQLLNLAHLDDDEPMISTPLTIRSPITTQQRTQHEQTLIDLDIKRRTFWACVLIERLFGDGKDRPTVISLREDDLSTRFPCPDNEFIIGKQVNTARFSTKPLPIWAPISKKFGNENEEADLFGQTMRIAELWSKVIGYVAKGGRHHDRRCPWLPESSFGRLDEQLSEWDLHLPSHLRYSESNLVAHCMIGQGKAYGLMHLLYFTSLLYLHRDYIPFLPPLDYNPRNGPIDGESLWHPHQSGIEIVPPNPDWWKTSADTCFRSANAVTDMLINLGHHASRLTNPFAGYAILTAGTMHIHLWFWPLHAPYVKNVGEYLASDTKMLNELKQTWSISQQWCQALNTYYALNSFIHDKDSSTVMTPPLHLVRAGLMKIININANQSTDQSIKSRPEGILELIKKTHDIFSEPWPEPSRLPIPTQSINHKQSQAEATDLLKIKDDHRFEDEIRFGFGHEEEREREREREREEEEKDRMRLVDLSQLNDWNVINFLSGWNVGIGNQSNGLDWLG